MPLWLLILIYCLAAFVVGCVISIAVTRFQEWIIRREEAEEPRGFPVKLKEPKNET